MSLQLICPLRDSKPCLEENCAIWVDKGILDKEVTGVDNSMTSYIPTGACAVKVLALKRN